MDALRHRLYLTLESGRANDRATRAFELAMCLLIVLNAAAVTLGTVPEIARGHRDALWRFEVFSVSVFTVEYLVRMWVCVLHPPLRALPPARARLRFALTPYALVDLLAIAPFYLQFLIPIDLRVLRVLRLLRLLKLARYSPAMVTIVRVLQEEKQALLGVLVIMFGLTTITATLAYYAERAAQPEAFGSIPQAMWWALATLTTVGFGDVVPATPVGKLLGVLVMLFGVGLFALPIAIISTGFAQEVHRRAFVVSWGMVARIPLFSHLTPAQMVDVARHLWSRELRAGTVIAHPDDPADCLYLIVNGRVLVEPEDATEPFVLSEENWFGEAALVAHSRRRVTLSADTDCRLLVLDAGDFHRMMHADEEFRRRIRAGLQRRAQDTRSEKDGPGRDDAHQP